MSLPHIRLQRRGVIQGYAPAIRSYEFNSVLESRRVLALLFFLKPIQGRLRKFFKRLPAWAAWSHRRLAGPVSCCDPGNSGVG